jgi:hypothetical protein
VKQLRALKIEISSEILIQSFSRMGNALRVMESWTTFSGPACGQRSCFARHHA